MLEKSAPLLFAFLWSTGFPAATLGLQYSEPMTFLAIRMGLVVLILLPFLWIFKLSSPYSKRDLFHAAWVGLLIHGIYLGGVFYSITLGIPGAIAAIIVSLQPILSSFIAHFYLHEKLLSRHIIGLVLGFIGTVIVLIYNTNTAISNDAPLHNILLAYGICVLSLLAITWAMIHQKKFATNIPPLPSFIAQYGAAAMFFSLMSYLFEQQIVNFAPGFFISLTWLVFMLSIGAIGLWMYLMQRRAVRNVASLFYLVPALAAIEGWILFGESFQPMAIFGIALTVIGVGIVVRENK